MLLLLLGKCMSMATAASVYDGYRLNSTYTYAQWDKDSIQGCVCDR
jgi:hypothetical protein